MYGYGIIAITITELGIVTMKFMSYKLAVVLLSGIMAITGILSGNYNSQANGINSENIAYSSETALKDEKITSNIDDSYDIFFMDDDASFKHKLADGVYWVPVNVLGKPQYSSEKLREIIDTSMICGYII